MLEAITIIVFIVWFYVFLFVDRVRSDEEEIDNPYYIHKRKDDDLSGGDRLG